ncbi:MULTISPECIES: hypothetical protein [Bradyrhizobium]|jgi:hypothetical protein|uniref:hypothetical protein n=1 Tax=Bradyrhizobium TaxID=374 RepID=UPI0004AFC683|nr:hypothetical protein [Bradyrhizobium elkanii]MCP1972969.1 hypothetical protein [Bradyrhizobium elkanii]MCS3520169.1 hypothetical protein [Bradyrhizobium elkanii]MCS4067824.1 hypothetical protein [Bradyrhizobium elkanii]MCS4083360.1 hypothetical protein [Bradyrhizobium elkanii]MCS4105524.1 hypothetical protein [Bradyrhizobium elkanii]
MSHVNRNANIIDPLFHPVSHYNSPGDVLQDARLSTDEKRVILSSWASDMYAVESQPALREVPGIPHRLCLADILAALKRLDEENDPPPRGGMAMPPPRFSKLVCAVSDPERHAATRRRRPLRISRADARWTREANVRRYRRLLDTQLTDAERNFIRRRLVEELKGLIASKSERRHTN